MNKKYMILFGVVLVAVVILAVLGANGTLFKGSAGETIGTVSTAQASTLTSAAAALNLALTASSNSTVMEIQWKGGSTGAALKVGDYIMTTVKVKSGANISSDLTCKLMDGTTAITSNVSYTRDGWGEYVDGVGFNAEVLEWNVVFLQFTKEVNIAAYGMKTLKFVCDTTGLIGKSTIQGFMPKEVPAGMNVPAGWRAMPTSVVGYHLGATGVATGKVNAVSADPAYIMTGSLIGYGF